MESNWSVSVGLNDGTKIKRSSSHFECTWGPPGWLGSFNSVQLSTEIASNNKDDAKREQKRY